MVPDLDPGEARIMMTWETNPPADMDIYVAAIQKSDNSFACLVSYLQQSCSTAAAFQIRLPFTFNA